MERKYSSFVVRCWRLNEGEHRIEVEHLQSGGRARIPTLAAVADWIAGVCNGPAGDLPNGPARANPPEEV